MSILNLKKNKKEAKPVAKKLAVKAETAVKVAKKVSFVSGSVDPSIILRPRVTEKATLLGASNVYTFEVTSRANAPMIKQVIKALYKVDPIKVSVLKIPNKNVMVRGKMGVKSGGRKAYVYLKKGDKIEIA